MTGHRVPAPLEAAAELATRIFGQNLLVGFIGGSHATGSATACSDIDTFVVLRAADLPAEYRYADALRALHNDASLVLDHCGEVLDRATLDHLLDAATHVQAFLPDIHNLACYQADCLLSVFRKADVIFKFLADPKIYAVGDREYLDHLEDQAGEYFRRNPRPRVQELRGRLQVAHGSRQQVLLDYFDGLQGAERWADTPAGVGLDRWFGNGRLPRTAAVPASVRRCSRSRCPLTAEPSALTPAARLLLAEQCLGARDHHTAATEDLA